MSQRDYIRGVGKGVEITRRMVDRVNLQGYVFTPLSLKLGINAVLTHCFRVGYISPDMQMTFT